MPSESQAQHNAMEAAAHGNSTLGIPASVGKEFVRADKAVHPFRRKRRRKRGGKKHRSTVSSAPLTLEASTAPSPLPNLRKRLSQLARKSHGQS